MQINKILRITSICPGGNGRQSKFVIGTIIWMQKLYCISYCCYMKYKKQENKLSCRNSVLLQPYSSHNENNVKKPPQTEYPQVLRAVAASKILVVQKFSFSVPAVQLTDLFTNLL